MEAVSLDIADEAALRLLLEAVRRSGPPLRGVWHGAGVLDDAALLQQDEGRLLKVLAPKVHGAMLLQRLTLGDPLECFVLFSSAAGVLGSAGQSNHAAANASLGTLAHERRARGLPALCIDWGAWLEIGAAADLGLGERLAAQGIGMLATSTGLLAMQRLLERGAHQAAVLPIDWPRYIGQRREIPVYLSALADQSVDAADSVKTRESGAVSSLVEQLAAAPAGRRRPLIAAMVRDKAVRALGLSPSKQIDPRMPLGELGLDSLLAVELRNTLGGVVGRPLPATLLFDYPTLDTLTDYLLQLLSPAGETAADEGVDLPAKAGLVESIEDLSDEEVERRLAQRGLSRN